MKRYNTDALSSLRAFALIFILCLSGCIEPFEPEGVQDTAGILVVEGNILDRGTTIKLSRTVEIDNIWRPSYFSLEEVNNAIVRVIDDNNHEIAVAKPQIVNGIAIPEYVVSSEIIFNTGTAYALDIQIGGKHYQSDFVTPLLTPEIDEISWRNNEGMSIDIMVSTHDPKNEIQYYRWVFEEDWEIRSQYFSPFIFDTKTNTFIEQSLSGPNNVYYCWASSKSKSILIGETTRFTEVTIKNRIIHNFLSTDTRFSYLYSVVVRQHGINKEAYTYYENIQKIIEQNSSLFALQPTELRGNIKCVSHPDEPVIGYIYASREVLSHRLFIDMSEMERKYNYNCTMEEYHENLMPWFYEQFNLGIISRNDRGMLLCVPRVCTDCTYHGGTKNKPDFWPNDHQ